MNVELVVSSAGASAVLDFETQREKSRGNRLLWLAGLSYCCETFWEVSGRRTPLARSHTVSSPGDSTEPKEE